MLNTIRASKYKLYKNDWRSQKGKDQYTWQWGASVHITCNKADTQQQAIESVIAQLQTLLASYKGDHEHA
jgi:hypothetical protein